MLLELAKWLSQLSPELRFFAVFNYLTLRALLAMGTALIIGWVAGPRVIRRLAEMKFGQAGYTDHGRCLDFDRDWYFCAVVGGFVQPLYLDFDAGDHGLWLGRLGG